MKKMFLLIIFTAIVNVIIAQVKVLSNGNVGFGTLTPVASFQIGSNWTFTNGGTKVIGYNYKYENGDKYLSSTADAVGVIRMDYTGIKFWMAPSGTGTITSWLTPLNILINGNIGIGTTTPPAKLTVNCGQTKTTGIAIKSSDVDLVLTEDATSNAGKIQVYSGGSASTIGSTTYRLVLQPEGGNVGIGVNDPSTYQLQLSLNSAGKPISSTWTIASDIRLKDVKGSYSKGLNEIIKLESIVYRYKKDNVMGIKETETDAYGFSAQAVQKIFPEAISSNEQGYLSLDMHPILIAEINAIKELQKIIEEQNVRINTLEQNSNLNNVTNSNLSNNSVVAKLFQNNPNPFSQNTEVKCIIPNNVNKAELYIYDMQGTQIKKVSISGKGEINTTIQGSELKAGMYMYTLIIDGKEIDTKRMILTN